MTDRPAAMHSEGEAVLRGTIRRQDEWARAKETEGVVCQTHVGGQALIEGIMMRGRYNWAVAVREPKGSIYTEEHDLASGRDKNSWLRKPVVRGCTALFESLMLGYRALDIASRHAFDFEEEDEKVEQNGQSEQIAQNEQTDRSEQTELQSISQVEAQGEPTASGYSVPYDSASEESAPNYSPSKDSPSKDSPSKDSPTENSVPKDSASEDSGIPRWLMTISMIIGVALGVVLFIVLPAYITNLIVGDYADKTLAWNLIDGVLRIVVFVFYLWLISLMKDIKRMFAYHGAEHKTIHCYEHGLELTVSNVRTFPTLHVRCGTAFLLMTMIIAILVFTITPIGPLIDLMGVTNAALRLVLVIVSRIILLPIIAGLSYEVTVKWAGSRPNSPFVQFVLWPGMQMQRLSTNEPDDGMLECAIAAMKMVLAREQREEAAKRIQIETPE